MEKTNRRDILKKTAVCVLAICAGLLMTSQALAGATSAKNNITKEGSKPWSLVILPDTQEYSRLYPGLFHGEFNSQVRHLSPLRREAEVYPIGCLKAQTFSWPGVEAVLNPGDLIRCDLGKRHFLREVLPDQAVGIFVESAFPAVVGFGKVALTAQFCGDSLVVGKLFSVIKGNGLNDFVFEQT